MIMDAAGSVYPPEEKHITELLDFVQAAKANTLHQSQRNVVLWIGPDGVIWAYRKPRRKIARRELIEVFRKP